MPSPSPVLPVRQVRPRLDEDDDRRSLLEEAFPSSPLEEDAQPSPVQPPPGLEQRERALSAQDLISQPESEMTPQISPHDQALDPPPVTTTLTQALRRSPDALDGLSSQRPTSDTFMAFLASKTERKYKKTTQKVGAGMELFFSKQPTEVQQGLIETMKKEWSNWEHYSDGQLITKAQVERLREELKKDGLNIRVIPTRWVHTNKAEPNQPMKLKSRLVVRGDLEDSSMMRCDSPTASHLALSLVLALSAGRDTDLWCGDISAAFLQGSKLDRVLNPVHAERRNTWPGVRGGNVLSSVQHCIWDKGCSSRLVQEPGQQCQGSWISPFVL